MLHHGIPSSCLFLRQEDLRDKSISPGDRSQLISLGLDARIGQSIGNIGYEIGEGDRQGNQNNRSLHHRKIAIVNGLQRGDADTGDVEK